MNWITRTVVGAAVGILGALGARMLRPIPTSLLHWSYRSHPVGHGYHGPCPCRTVRQELKQPVIVVNRSGAAGNIGAASVARANNDGYTLLMTSAPFAIAPAIFPDLSFHPIKDFTAITQISMVPLLVVTRANSPLNSISDLVAAAKQNKESISLLPLASPLHPISLGRKYRSWQALKCCTFHTRVEARQSPNCCLGRCPLVFSTLYR